MEGLYLIIGIAIAVWLLSSKQWRKSMGSSLTEASKLTQQSVIVARASAYKEAKEELGDVTELIKESDKLLK